MKIGFIAMSGVRAENKELTQIGLTLPGIIERNKIVASLPSLSLLTLAALTPRKFEVDYKEIADLNKEILLTREIGSGTRITVERFTGLDFNSDIQINSNEAIVEAVQAGLGIGFVSKHSVNLQLKNNIIKQLDVAPFPIIRQWHIVHHAEAELSPIARRFKQFVIENT